MIRSHIAKLVAIAAAAVAIIAPVNASAQTLEPSWKIIGNLSQNIAPINQAQCDSRLIFSSTSSFYGRHSTRVQQSRARHFTPPTNYTGAATLSLAYDITKEDLLFMNLAGILTTAQYQKIESLFQNTPPFSLSIAVTLQNGKTPVAYLLYPNRNAVSAGESFVLAKPAVIQLETYCK